MIPYNAQALKANLGGIKDVSNVRVEGTSLKDFVQATIKDSLEQIKRVRLTWSKGQVRAAVNERFVKGKLRMDLPYVGPIGRGRYFIQNATVFDAAGQKLKDLTTVDREPIVEQVQQKGGGFLAVKFPSDWDRLKEAMQFHVTAALSQDPNLCPYCVRFSEVDRKRMTHHMMSKHPKEFAKEQEDEMQRVAANPPAEDEAPPVYDVPEKHKPVATQ